MLYIQLKIRLQIYQAKLILWSEASKAMLPKTAQRELGGIGALHVYARSDHRLQIGTNNFELSGKEEYNS